MLYPLIHISHLNHVLNSLLLPYSPQQLLTNLFLVENQSRILHLIQLLHVYIVGASDNHPVQN